MNKKITWLIVLVCFVTYGNALFNSFVGDDVVVIGNNDFYQSVKNIPKLFTKEYSTDPRNLSIFIARDQNKNSGSVAYRPVLSLTYFLDALIWEKRPFGFHLTNLVLHTLCTLLMFLFVLRVLQSETVAFLSSLLFAVHPINAEVVCNAGFRADVLAATFILLSILNFIQFREKNISKNLWASYVFVFLALFSKESAIIAFPLILGIDYYLNGFSVKKLFSLLKKEYIGFIVITLFYLFVYFFVFPNTSFHQATLMGGALGAHILRSVQIFTHYLVFFVFPMTVQVLPPFYSPPVESMLWPVLTLILFVLGFILVSRSNRRRAFFMFWFLVALFPVSNIIPIVNPMATRFLYLPSIGLLVVIAIVIENLCEKFKDKTKIMQFPRIIKIGCVLLCMAITIPLNTTWRNHYNLAFSLIQNFPKNPWGYFTMGVEHFRYANLGETKSILEKSVSLGLVDPRAYHMLGVCYFNKPQKAIHMFQKSINLFPKYSLAYTGMGRILLFKKNNTDEALSLFEKTLELAPLYSAYGYAIQIHLKKGDEEKAQKVFKDAQQKLNKEEELESLEKFFTQESQNRFPIDIGV